MSPSSRADHLSFLINKVITLKPSSILDVGVGFGSKGLLFREYCDIWNGDYYDWRTQIDGIEIFPDYITDLQKKIYDHIFIGNVLAVLPLLENYDLIYAGDILEHLTRENGLKLLELLKQHGKHVIIATPRVVSAQGAVFGNIDETHRSQWTPDDFKGADINYFNNIMVACFNNEKQVYYSQGIKFYGEKVPLKKYDDIHAPTVFVGLYFQTDYDVFNGHCGKKSVFWNGSDVLRMLQNPTWTNIVKNSNAKHFCHNIQLHDELKSIGIDAEITPLFFGYKENYTTHYKPSKRPKVFLGSHPGRNAEYGVDLVTELADELKDIEFHIYGVDGEGTDNIIYHGQIPEEQMDVEIRDFQACLRMNKHDGMSQVVCKSMFLGIYPIITSDKETIKEELEKIKEKDEPWQGDVSKVKDLNWIQNMVTA